MIPFYQSVNGGPPEPITALSPIAWYRYGVGITSAATLVSAWADQSGNANDLVQATGTNQPTLQSDNSILFDGTDNFMQAAFTFDQPNTVYWLLRQVTWTLNDRIFDGVAAAARVVQSATTPGLIANAGANSTQSDSLVLNTYGIVCCVFNGASGRFQINNNTVITGNFGANNAGGLTLAAINTVGGQFGNIQVKEGIAFPVAHDAATRATVITYLATVGGVNL